jgi:hypothetical protein
MATNILDGIFTPRLMLQWQDWECFVAEFEAFHNNVLIELGKEVQSLQEIYHGAYGHKQRCAIGTLEQIGIFQFQSYWNTQSSNTDSPMKWFHMTYMN